MSNTGSPPTVMDPSGMDAFMIDSRPLELSMGQPGNNNPTMSNHGHQPNVMYQQGFNISNINPGHVSTAAYYTENNNANIYNAVPGLPRVTEHRRKSNATMSDVASGPRPASMNASRINLTAMSTFTKSQAKAAAEAMSSMSYAFDDSSDHSLDASVSSYTNLDVAEDFWSETFKFMNDTGMAHSAERDESVEICQLCDGHGFCANCNPDNFSDFAEELSDDDGGDSSVKEPPNPFKPNPYPASNMTEPGSGLVGFTPIDANRFANKLLEVMQFTDNYGPENLYRPKAYEDLVRTLTPIIHSSQTLEHAYPTGEHLARLLIVWVPLPVVIGGKFKKFICLFTSRVKDVIKKLGWAESSETWPKVISDFFSGVVDRTERLTRDAQEKHMKDITEWKQKQGHPSGIPSLNEKRRFLGQNDGMQRAATLTTALQKETEEKSPWVDERRRLAEKRKYQEIEQQTEARVRKLIVREAEEKQRVEDERMKKLGVVPGPRFDENLAEWYFDLITGLWKFNYWTVEPDPTRRDLPDGMGRVVCMNHNQIDQPILDLLTAIKLIESDWEKDPLVRLNRDAEVKRLGQLLAKHTLALKDEGLKKFIILAYFWFSFSGCVNNAAPQDHSDFLGGVYEAFLNAHGWKWDDGVLTIPQ